MSDLRPLDVERVYAANEDGRWNPVEGDVGFPYAVTHEGTAW
jgi:hypothetical protein